MNLYERALFWWNFVTLFRTRQIKLVNAIKPNKIKIVWQQNYNDNPIISKQPTIRIYSTKQQNGHYILIDIIFCHLTCRRLFRSLFSYFSASLANHFLQQVVEAKLRAKLLLQKILVIVRLHYATSRRRRSSFISLSVSLVSATSSSFCSLPSVIIFGIFVSSSSSGPAFVELEEVACCCAFFTTFFPMPNFSMDFRNAFEMILFK